MSGFSADWLALREPADHRARNREVLTATAWLFSGRESAEVLDLGCGTGSNLRALAPALPHEQTWRLVDHDPALLAAARTALTAWAETSGDDGEWLVLGFGRKTLRVRFVEADIAGGIDRLLVPMPDLVTAAALFDLVSARWLEAFAATLARVRLPLYTTLIYNGDDSFAPPHPADARVHAAFAAHMGRDKGFGPAAGGAAARVLTEAFARAGYRVVSGDSPWRLGPDAAALVRELVGGIAGAVAEVGVVHAAELAAWRDARLAAQHCTIGHTDLVAIPPAL